MRENGFYWIKFYDNDFWGIGHFENNNWLIIGSEELFKDKDFYLIGEKITEIIYFNKDK